MATEESTPPRCDSQIFEEGEGVCVVDGSSEAIEDWVKKIAEVADAKLDWHYSCGRANVLHLGSDESRQCVLRVIHDLKDELDGTILSVGGPALPRNGVDDPTAVGPVVRDIGGQLVLDDPEAVEFVHAFEEFNR